MYMQSVFVNVPSLSSLTVVIHLSTLAYAQALQSVLLSCDQREGNANHRASTRRVASMYAQSQKK